MRRTALFCCIAFLLTTLALPVFAQPLARQHAQSSAPQPDWLIALNGEACSEDSDFTCVTITVPLDHNNPENGETLDVVFAVLPATGTSKGLFVTATGGPGTAGTELADDYTSYFDESILENFDIVFFDQRGIGRSGDLDCPDAVAAYSLTNSRPNTPQGEAAYLADARTFAEDCQAEMDSPDLLHYLSTEQAVQDLEAFRQLAGDQPVWLYGESYGTQYAQTYAAAYPEHIAGLILDGVVDLTLSGTDYYAVDAQAFSDVLTRSLEACNADQACSSDFGTDAVEFYDDFAAEVLTAPVPVDFPLADSSSETRAFDINMLETDALNAVYGRYGRADFLRELAAAAHGDLLPLMREFYSDAAVDPFTFEPITDPSYFTSMYYAVECSDYDYFSGTPDERGQSFIDSYAPIKEQVPRLSITYFTDLPCVYWGTHGSSERPAPFTGGDYVTFVLNTSTDPATPTSNGYAVYDRLIEAGRDTYMITMQGGPHVLFGRGETCPDVAVTAWMVDGTLPTNHEYVCPGSVIADYTPLNPSNFADYASPLQAIQAVDQEINLLPEYVGWDGSDDMSVGCGKSGGTITFQPTDDGELWTFMSCTMIEGFTLTGGATYTYGESIAYDVTVNGNRSDYVVYTHDLATDMYTIQGQFEGEPLLTPRLAY